MRVAVCFSGQPRFINESKDLILRNVIGDLKVDVFAHFWFDESITEQPYKYGGAGNWVNQRISKESINDFISIYKPVSLKTEPSKQFYDQHLLDTYEPSLIRYKWGSINNPLDPDFSRRDINNSISYHYSLSEVASLKKEYEYKNNFKYDVVVRLRSDALIHTKLDFNAVEDNTIYYSNCQHQPDGMINDWLNFGKSTAMDTFMSSFLLIDTLISDSKNETNGAWCNEMLHKKLVDRFQIKPSPLDISITLPRF